MHHASFPLIDFAIPFAWKTLHSAPYRVVSFTLWVSIEMSRPRRGHLPTIPTALVLRRNALTLSSSALHVRSLTRSLSCRRSARRDAGSVMLPLHVTVLEEPVAVLRE